MEHRVEDLEAWLHADVGELDATSSDCSECLSFCFLFDFV